MGGGGISAEDPQPLIFTCADHIFWTWHGSSNPDIFFPSFLDFVWACSSAICADRHF
jgi:hypothetical protein